jgi:hypothetical protein
VTARAELDRLLPSRGPCGICRVPGLDARHRVIDAADQHAQAGEAAGDIADELGLSPETVRVILAWCAETGPAGARGPWLDTP